METEKKPMAQPMHFATFKENANQSFDKPLFNVVQHDESVQVFDANRIYRTLVWASEGYEESVSIDLMAKEAVRNMYDGISSTEVTEALILAAVAFIEKDPAYGYVAAQLLLKKLFYEVTNESIEK